MRDGLGPAPAAQSTPPRGTADRGRRGQILIIGALVMALFFVLLATVVNAGIYAGVTATDASTEDAGAASGAAHQTEHVLADARRTVNANHATDHTALVRNLTAALTTSEQALADEYAMRGAAYALSNVSTTNRTAIVHDNASRNFTDATGTTDWTLADAVVETGTFRLDVDRDALAGPAETGRFRIRITNGSATWSVAVAHDQDTGDVTIEVTTDTGSTTCAETTETARIDLTDGTLNGTECSNLAYAGFVDGQYAVSYENATNATGEYAVNATTADAVATTPYASGAASPRATYSLSSVTVRHTYRNTNVVHAANVTVP